MLPLKKIKIKAYKSDWLSKGILISCRQKNVLFKKYKQNPTIENEATYNTYKNKLTHIIRQSKKMHFKNKFELYKKDCKKTWNTINEVLKSKNKKHMVNDKFITSEGTSCTDKNEIVEQFNKYFTNIGSILNSKLPKSGEDPTQHIKHNTESFFCAPTDPTEIINIVKSANSSKSSGVDNIDPYVVQKIIPQIANQLAHMFNKSLQTGIVPDKLKIAKVIPLYKNDNPELFKNYRPISILPCFSKIIERIMYNRLYSFLTKHNSISEKQYGFRKKYATYMALIDLVDKISCNFAEKNYTVGIFLDLSKAFDTIDHTILLNKLQCYGVRGSACNWFASYLHNRKQYVVFNKSESEYKEISCGVPQGSILGPLLFILYINDIEHVSDIIKPILFADDTSLFHSHACFNTLIQEVNIQLHQLSTWFNTNKLSLNTNKSNFIIFTPNGKKYNISEAEININGSKIKHVKCTTFLGITIDEHLDWKVHIDNLSYKIARNVGVLNKLKNFLPAYIMKTLYSTLIESHLQYCTLLWANSHVTNIRKLQLLQKKAIRIITSSHYIAHTEPLLSMTKLLKLDDLYKYKLGIFMHKVTHCQLPQNMSSMFYEQSIYTVINSETIMHIISNK